MWHAVFYGYALSDAEKPAGERKNAMHPICFEFLGRPIYWYGVFVAGGFLAAVLNWNILAQRDGRAPGFGSELGFWVMFSGLVGARLAYVFANLDYYLAEPVEILRIDRGGLVFYGGVVGGFVGMVLFAWKRKLSILAMGDLTVTGLVIGHAFGRVGCFLNGCCFGAPATRGPSVSFPGESPVSVHQHSEGLLAFEGLPSLPVYPIQLYEAGLNLLLYLSLVALYLRPGRKPGRVAALYLMLYAVIRFGTEHLRGDTRILWAGLHVAQVVSIVLFMAGLAIWVATTRKANPVARISHRDGREIREIPNSKL